MFVLQVMSLLQPSSFLDVMVQLVGVVSERGSGDSSHEVRRRALEILAVQMEGRRFRFGEEHVSAGVSLWGFILQIQTLLEAELQFVND